LFSGETLQNSRNTFLEAELFLSYYVKEIKKTLTIDSSFEEFIHASDQLLIKLLKERYQDTGFINAVYHILKNQGNIRIDELTAQCFIGERQLERLFRTRIDLSPKQFTDLIRYQNAWRGIFLRQDVNELVLQLGYSDQSHLLRSFKKYHGIAPSEAKLFAHRCKKVEFHIAEHIE
jgi:AraC-like DNA-binding protein